MRAEVALRPATAQTEPGSGRTRRDLAPLRTGRRRPWTAGCGRPSWDSSGHGPTGSAGQTAGEQAVKHRARRFCRRPAQTGTVVSRSGWGRRRHSSRRNARRSRINGPNTDLAPKRHFRQRRHQLRVRRRVTGPKRVRKLRVGPRMRRVSGWWQTGHQREVASAAVWAAASTARRRGSSVWRRTSASRWPRF